MVLAAGLRGRIRMAGRRRSPSGSRSRDLKPLRPDGGRRCRRAGRTARTWSSLRSSPPLGLTYDDVLLLPGETDVVPSEVDTTHPADPRDHAAGPAGLARAMDTVTESRMAIAMARQGGIGVLHRNLSIEDQAYQVDLVKRTQTGMISNPVTIGPDATLEELDEICGEYRVSGLPVVDADNRLLGIITNRDLRFAPGRGVGAPPRSTR